MTLTLPRLAAKTGRHYLGANLAVMLGVAAASLALTGALLVGDSLRFSLGSLVEKRLGWVAEAVISPRFFQQKSVERLGAGKAIPAILLHASVQIRDDSDCLLNQVGKVQILGVPDSFWAKEGLPPGWADGNSCILSPAMAKKLLVTSGAALTVRVESASSIPKESFLGNRDDSLASLPLKVSGILPEGDSRSGFNLFPGLDPPMTIFVPLPRLQEHLKTPGKVNCALTAEKGLQAAWEKILDLEDYQLSLAGPTERTTVWLQKLDKNHDGILQKQEYSGKFPARVADSITAKAGPDWTKSSLQAFYESERNYLSLETSSLLLSQQEVDAATLAGKELGLEAEPALVYLANSIQGKGQAIPYAIVAGVSDKFLNQLGASKAPAGSNPPVWLQSWNESPLKLTPGDPLDLRYFPPESTGNLQEITRAAVFAGTLNPSPLAMDPDITPDFPGITDKLTLDSWNPPFPFDNKRIKPADEKYWRDFRTIPKAFLKLKDAQELWASRFGQITSLRFFLDKNNLNGNSPRQAFRGKLLSLLSPESLGLHFQPVKERFSSSSQSGTDFSGLFLGFSSFLIVSSLALVSLLFRLQMEQRATQIGCLKALGATPWQITLLLWMEGMAAGAVGSALGALSAGFYTRALLHYLAHSWPDGSLANVLQLHLPGATLLLGGGATFFMCLAALYFASRKLSRIPPLPLLRGKTENPVKSGQTSGRTPLTIAAGCFLAMAGVLLSPTSQDHELRAFKFFGAGMLGLTAGLFFLTWLLRNLNRLAITAGNKGWFLLALRNLSRNRPRSLLTSGLLAAAAFLIMGVEPFRKEPEKKNDLHSGTGGFSLVMETSLPVLADLATPSGRETLVEGIRKSQRGDPGKGEALVKALDGLLQKTAILSFRLQPGDNASCLNLFQPAKPRILGVPDALVQRQGFRFTAGSQPWQGLDNPSDPIPSFGEKNTVEWMIHSGLGKTIKVQDGLGAEKTLQFQGLMSHCLFQSELLVSERNFLRLFPQRQGFSFFLVEAQPGDLAQLENFLTLALADQGVIVTRARELLDRFGSVENAYLSIFQGLGSLGLLLGTAGVAAVLLRSIWERRFEMALLGCLGFPPALRGRLLLLEHGLLLLAGLSLGATSALASVLPLAQGEMRWVSLLLVLLVLFTFGLTVCAGAVFVNRPRGLVEALRKE
ncbi:MAG: ABC transporter permease [Gemmataceae bacterium]|nr:ABC transporter permease [Gemmataceae bacterium]